METISIKDKVLFRDDLESYVDYSGRTFGESVIKRICGKEYEVSDVDKKLMQFKIVGEYRWFPFEMIEDCTKTTEKNKVGSSTAYFPWLVSKDSNVKKDVDQDKQKKEKKEILKPFEIKEKLDEYVIGQEDAKIALSIAAYSHYLRLNQSKYDGVEIQKGNILMIGKSGSGKTLIVETLSKVLDVPFVTVDITEFAPTGIVGKHADDIIKDLKSKAGGDVKKAEQGIVFIDEVDKLASSSSEEKGKRHGILSSETQATLLKLLEGKEIQAETSMFSLFGGSSEPFNTKNILFICAGAFSGIEEIVGRESFQQKRMGFGCSVNFEKKEVRNPDANDIIEYGLMPEIVGRLPIIVNLHPLEKQHMISILTEPKNALIKQYEKLFKMAGKTKLEFSKDAIDLIAEYALKNETGARGLRTIIEPIINKALFVITQGKKFKRCIITKECILNKTEPTMIKE